MADNKTNGGGFFADKNSNAYILFYATVMVVIVAALLATVAMSLKSRQEENALNEKKMAILTALSVDTEMVKYDDYIVAIAVDTLGRKIEGIDGVQTIGLLSDLKGTFENGVLPLFVAADGRVVVPVTGAGLWGPIWGYVALRSNLNYIDGIVIDHASETPGLGAEIATEAHQAMYKGKRLFDTAGRFTSVTLKKGGAATSGYRAYHEVDAITGGTKTSDGVTAMLSESLSNYVPLFRRNRSTVRRARLEVPMAASYGSVSDSDDADENNNNN
ncbi:MAG: FMN-binding protein [Rikenellaceae bacterium]